VGFDRHERVQRRNRRLRTFDLGQPDPICGVNDLPLQVAGIDEIVIDDKQRPTPEAARYNSAGEPNPPAPTTRTRASRSFLCPGPPISRSRMCRA